MPITANLHVGLSFAAVEVFKDSAQILSRQLYLPQEPLATSLRKIWDTTGLPTQVQLHSRYLERILDAKLGGSVAQIVTKGFETWTHVSQPTVPPFFSLTPHRQSPLASPDLIFGISARINSQGQEIRPVDIEELTFIEAKLKLMSVKRVCLNLLFSNLNPIHHHQLTLFFQEAGYEVLGRPRVPRNSPQPTVDVCNCETTEWRRNIMNACLMGAFQEHIDEIKKSFGDSPVELLIGNESGDFFTTDNDSITGSLFSWARLLATRYQNKYDVILDLDLEKWSLIKTNIDRSTWRSAWGPIAIRTPFIATLQCQPSQELQTNSKERLVFSQDELGFEPGPMIFGKAHKITRFDILAHHCQLQLPQIQPAGSARLRDQMTAIIKNHQLQGRSTVEPGQLSALLTDDTVLRIAMDVMSQTNTTDRILVRGFFAPSLQPLLKKFKVQTDLAVDGGTP